MSSLGAVRCFTRHHQLIWQMIRREVVGRYRGSIMGLTWSFFNPLIMLSVYAFVFSTVFKARWGVGPQESMADFAIILFVGMIVHGLFAECVNRAPDLIVSNVNYVKKVVFPLETLPWVAMGSALFHAAVSLMVLMGAQLVLTGRLPWTAIMFQFVIAPLVFVTMGIAWFLAAAGVYVRDIRYTTGVLVTVLQFISPVFYPITALPPKYQQIMLLNPLTLVIEGARDVLIWGKVPGFLGWGISLVASLLVAWFGFWWFQYTRRGFADVL